MSDIPPTPVPPIEEPSASAKIREELRIQVIPQIVKEGKDPSSKDIYPAYCKQLASKYSVDYNTVKKSWDKVLRELGTKPPEIVTKKAKVGGVEMTTTPQPKEAPKKEAEPTGVEEEPELTTEETKELNVKIFTSIHEVAGESLFSIVESVWGVEIKRPDPKKFEDAGKLWAEVAEAYNWKVPKVIMLVGAIAMSGEMFATPLIKGRAEAIRKAEELAGAKKT